MNKGFNFAVLYVLLNEGGLSDIEADRGGLTNYGVTLDLLRDMGMDGDQDNDGDIDERDIRALTKDDVAKIWLRLRWDKYGYDRIKDEWIAAKILDAAINFGPRQAHIITQRAVLAVGEPIKVDGILGPITIQAVNAVNPLCLMAALCSECAGVYRMIVAKDPSQLVFLTGWLNRAYRRP